MGSVTHSLSMESEDWDVFDGNAKEKGLSRSGFLQYLLNIVYPSYKKKKGFNDYVIVLLLIGFVALALLIVVK